MMTPDSEVAVEDVAALEAYNPNQPIQQRREVGREIRAVEAKVLANTENLLKDDNDDLDAHIHELNEHSKNIKQTAEAAIESKVFMTLTDLSMRKTLRASGGSVGNGIDVDQFLSKAITYMRTAAGIADDEDEELTHTQRNRRRPAVNRHAGSDYEDDEDGNGDMLNWPHFGRYAAIPNVRRPALPGFLLGPLSVQKKARKVVIRTAPLRIRDMQEVRPEILRVEDIEKNEAGDLTAICVGVHKELRQAQKRAHARMERVMEDDDKDDDDVAAEMEKLGIAPSGNLDMMRFCLNPKSFGQTVENLFYVSFLIRDAHVSVNIEENGLPSLGKPLPLAFPFLALFNTNYQPQLRVAIPPRSIHPRRTP